MTRQNRTYRLGQVVSCLIMLLALAWLTVSLPFVNEAQKTVKQLQVATPATPDEDTSNPLSNTTEEKSVNLISEYLHDICALEQHPEAIVRFYKCHPSQVYRAFHPDSFSPPPEVLL